MNLKAHIPVFPQSLISVFEMFESGVPSLTLRERALALRAVPPHLLPISFAESRYLCCSPMQTKPRAPIYAHHNNLPCGDPSGKS